MKEVTCACGATFSAASDEELFMLTRKHADEQHPELRMSDEQIRALVAASARDAS
jgi:predicted small metal-binding protein